jgi:hypothetical protein
MMTKMTKVALIVALVLAPAVARSQDTAGPPQNVRMRIGPLFVNPTLALSNAGKDTNVFNDAKDPKEDFTVTISPGTDLWLRFGPTWLSSNIREDLIWFNRYASERSANNSYSLKWVAPLNRLTVSPEWVHTNTRSRPSYEIDARAERTETSYRIQLDYRLFTKTFLGGEASQGKTDFADGTVFLGADLRTELNVTTTSEALTLRHLLTPLTSVTVQGELTNDRFEFDHLRDSQSRSVTGSIKFDPAALLKGSASFGYLDFTPTSPDVPAYRGSTFVVNLSYVLLGVMQAGVTATRDTHYSFDINQPYYLQTGFTGAVSQQLFGPVDVTVRGLLQRLEYRDRTGAVVAVANRVDHAIGYGGGLGYHVGKDMRVGVNADYSTRESAVDFRRYQGWTYGVAITYSSVQVSGASR